MRKELKQAQRDRAYVEVVRRRGWVRTCGFVAAVGDEWFALVSVEDAVFEGVYVLRIRDVRRLEPLTRRTLHKRVLQRRGQWPPSVPELLDLDDTRRLAWTAGSLCRTLGVSEEGRTTRGVFHAGNTARITKKWWHLWEIDPKARWKGSISVRLDRLTRVILWMPYVETITAIADAHEGNLWAERSAEAAGLVVGAD